MAIKGQPSRVKRRAQPQGGAQIDWSNPITKGLVLCTHAGANFVELTTRKPSTITSATPTTTTKGKAFANSATTYSIETPVNGNFGEAVTWVVGSEVASFGGGGLGRFADKRTAASATQVELFYLNQPSTNIQFQRVTSSVTQTIGSASGLSFPAPFAVYAVTVSSITASDGAIYINGVPQSLLVNTLGSGSMLTNTANYVIGNRTNDNTRNMDGKIEFAYRWNRALSAREIASISRNPYQLFKPANSNLWLVPASSGITGTLATTDATDVLSAAGTLAVTSTLAKTDATDVTALAGIVATGGSLAVTDATDTTSLAGSVVAGIAGSLGVTDGTDTLAASGALEVTSTLGYTDATDTFTAAGAVALAGTLGVTDATDTTALAGTVASSSITGTLGVTDDADVFFVRGSDGSTIELLGGGPGGPKRKGKPEKGSYWGRLLSPPLQDRLEAIEPEAAEVIEAVVQVVPVSDPVAQEAEMRRAMEQAGIAYREAYREIYTELLAEMRRQDDEDEELLLLMA